MATADRTLRLARDVAASLRQTGIEPLLIGALAMASHGYVRTTQDVDFAVAVAPPELEQLAALLSGQGFAVDHSAPSADDPLGGVITITRSGALPVQIVNFDNSPGGGFPAAIDSRAG